MPIDPDENMTGDWKDLAEKWADIFFNNSKKIDLKAEKNKNSKNE